MGRKHASCAQYSNSAPRARCWSRHFGSYPPSRDQRTKYGLRFTTLMVSIWSTPMRRMVASTSRLVALRRGRRSSPCAASSSARAAGMSRRRSVIRMVVGVTMDLVKCGGRGPHPENRGRCCCPRFSDLPQNCLGEVEQRTATRVRLAESCADTGFRGAALRRSRLAELLDQRADELGGGELAGAMCLGAGPERQVAGLAALSRGGAHRARERVLRGERQDRVAHGLDQPDERVLDPPCGAATE